jgi:hypothetical protein
MRQPCRGKTPFKEHVYYGRRRSCFSAVAGVKCFAKGDALSKQKPTALPRAPRSLRASLQSAEWLKRNIHDGYAFVNALCAISQFRLEILYKLYKALLHCKMCIEHVIPKSADYLLKSDWFCTF